MLKELGEPSLFENENFKVLPVFENSPDYVITHLALETSPKINNALPIIIWFEGNDLRIDIDGIPETFEWAKKHIDQDKNTAIKFIENLFTGFVLIDYRGSSARFVQMFDADGFFIRSFSRNVLFHIFGRYLLRQKDFRRLFLPLFKKLK